MSFTSQATKEAKQNIKQTKKESKGTNTEMKNQLKTTLKYLTVIAITLGVVYAAFVIRNDGYKQGVHDQKAQAAEVQTQVATQVKTLKDSEK